VVEDNEELRQFIRVSLQNEYEILEAKKGTEGFDLAIRYVPDLVLTDWMMPGLSGIDLCKTLKENEITSHIPVVLLTALAESKSKLQGLDTGADDYLTKPFEMPELKARLRNLIRERRKLREKYARINPWPHGNVKIESTDERFLKKFYDEIQREVGNPDLTIEGLSRALGVSRVQLHRKLTALTGRSASDLLREYRLSRAADLLRKNVGNVSEVAYQVGFDNLSYFTKAFRQKYDMTPSEFKQSV
jgi:DNA-binding response OmpR family regulator